MFSYCTRCKKRESLRNKKYCKPCQDELKIQISTAWEQLKISQNKDMWEKYETNKSLKCPEQE